MQEAVCEAPEGAPVSAQALVDEVREAASAGFAAANEGLSDNIARAEAALAEMPDSSRKRFLRRRLSEMKNVRSQIGSREGAALDFMLICQPDERQLAMSLRPKALMVRARSRLAKQKVSYPEISEIVGAIGTLVVEEDKAVEACHRVLHFLAFANLRVYGFAALRWTKQIVRSARSKNGGPPALDTLTGEDAFDSTVKALYGILGR